MLDEAIVLAGGFGTRLRTVVSDVPKPMAPIGDRPFLELLLADLAGKGFRSVVLSVGYKAELIEAHFGAEFASMAIRYCREDTPLGTGGAVRMAMTLTRSDAVFVFNGDTFLDLEVERLRAHFRNRRHPVIVTRRVEDTARYGRVLTDGKTIQGFAEKGASGPGLINAGCYLLPAHQLDAFKPGENFSLEQEYFVPATKSELFDVFVTDGLFIDIGVPEDYARAQVELAGR